jgi:glycosyltransferase involved in cell wall biosynthesis
MVISMSATSDQKQHAVILTSYPPKDTLYGKGVGGLASFAKNTVISMERDTNFTILAEYFDQPEAYHEDDNFINRCWKRDSFSLFPAIIKSLNKNKHKTATLLVEFEFSIYGGWLISGFFPIILFAAKFMKYDITLVLHQVVRNFSDLAPHLGIKKGSLKNRIVAFLMKLYYKVLCWPSRRIIVLDQIHKDRLRKIIGHKEIHAIPHGVDTRVTPAKASKRPSSNSPNKPFTIMSFGFLTWYKGSDWLIDMFSEFARKHPGQKDFKLVLAGGESPTQKDSPHYQEFYKNLQNKAAQYPDTISIAGFVPEEEIPMHFEQADLVVLPYRVLMSSSGPLSLAISYRRPFILSDKLIFYTRTEDFLEALAKLDLTPQDIIHPHRYKEFFSKIRSIKQDHVMYDTLSRLSNVLRESRSWEKLGEKYQAVIFPQ